MTPADLTARLRSWSYRRQLLGRAGTAPLNTLRSVIAVYSTHPTAPLALLARSERLERTEFLALEQQKQVVRIVGMRGSGFLVPTETAARILAATLPPPDQLEKVLRPRGLDLETYMRLVPLVLECCARPVTPAELRHCAATDEDVYMVARVLARRGRVLRRNKPGRRSFPDSRAGPSARDAGTELPAVRHRRAADSWRVIHPRSTRH